MNRHGRIKRLLRSACRTDPDESGRTGTDERILRDASIAMRQALINQRPGRILAWRTIMKTKRARLGSTIAAAVLVGFIITCWNQASSTAWSMGQTIAAMRELKTIHIKGTTLYQSGRVDFDCWMMLPGKKAGPVKMRYEETHGVIVVQGDVAYYWLREDNEVQVMQGPQMEDLKFWYRASEFSPWCMGKMLEILKLFTDDWEQVVQTDPNTGQEQVLVTCSYRPSNRSLSFVVDMGTKLVQRGKMWSNLQREGEPGLDAHTILYNEEVPDKVFEFEIPAGAKVVTEGSETNILMGQAHSLRDSKNYTEAIKVFQQVYERFPDSFEGKLALLFIGVCHYRQGQFDEAIAAYQRGIREYPWRDSWLELAYFDLGRSYREQGQNAQALEALENCLTANEENPRPDSSRSRKVREYIAQLKGE